MLFSRITRHSLNDRFGVTKVEVPSHGSWLSGENQIMDLPTNTLRGKLILDGGSLAGSFFHRSVLLICQHDEEGAFGLILNRPLSPPPATASPFKLPNSLKNHSIFVGGPVQPGALSFQ